MKYTWLVEKYLEGELSGDALRKFELDILRKSEVAEEVEKVRSLNRFVMEQHKRMQGSVGLIEDFEDLDNIISKEEIGSDLNQLRIRKISSSQKDVDEFKARVTESGIRNTLSNNRSNKVLVKKVSIWMVSASLLLLIVVSSLLLIGGKDINYSDLYSQYYHAPPAEVERTAIAISDDPYQTALKAYNKADFQRAFQVFNGINNEGINNEYYLYFGITAMELGKFPLAIELFENLNTDAYLRHQAMWFKSLCYLGLEDENSIRAALNKIIREDGYYKKMAAHLLRKI